jgi:hypothetical protein
VHRGHDTDVVWHTIRSSNVTILLGRVHHAESWVHPKLGPGALAFILAIDIHAGQRVVDAFDAVCIPPITLTGHLELALISTMWRELYATTKCCDSG